MLNTRPKVIKIIFRALVCVSGVKITNYILATLNALFLRSNNPPLKILTNEIVPFSRLIENQRPDKNG